MLNEEIGLFRFEEEEVEPQRESWTFGKEKKPE